jgi:hypothetical protein
MTEKTDAPEPAPVTASAGGTTASGAQAQYDEVVQALNEKYLAALHAMQTAVGAILARELGHRLERNLPDLHNSREVARATSELLVRLFKDLRTGINSSFADQAAVVDLLIEKGVFTREEYATSVLVWAEKEAEISAAEARRVLGLPGSVTFR